MNWYKKAQIVMRADLDWDKIAHELQEELGRPPTVEEIQEVLSDNYWNSPQE